MAFPRNPVVGEEYLVDDTVYRYNGSSWDHVVIGSANRTNYMVTAALLTRIAHLEALIEQGLLIID